MQLTEKNKKVIDEMSYEDLLSRWRFSLIDDPWFQDETGEYWRKRMAELRSKESNPAEISKKIGWSGK